MNNPAPAAPSRSGSIDPKVADGMQALRAGLELARASQLTMVRLQLALHKSNRRTAMQALDTLLDIDAEMERLAAMLTAARIPSAGDAALPGFIGLQRAAIATEKHALTGGHGRNDARPITIAAAPGDWAGAADPSAQPPLPDDQAEGEDRAGGRRWLLLLAIAIAVILLGFGLTAYLRPDLLAAVMPS